MSRSAGCYTNLRKIVAEAKNTKVEYPGNVAKNWNVLQPTINCNPNFQVIEYVQICNCTRTSILLKPLKS